MRRAWLGLQRRHGKSCLIRQGHGSHASDCSSACTQELCQKRVLVEASADRDSNGVSYLAREEVVLCSCVRQKRHLDVLRLHNRLHIDPMKTMQAYHAI